MKNTKLPVTTDTNIPPIKKCPHCGCEDGYYTKDYVYGTSRYNYLFNGEEAENSELYAYLGCKSGKIAYCVDCNEAIFRIAEV